MFGTTIRKNDVIAVAFLPAQDTLGVRAAYSSAEHAGT